MALSTRKVSSAIAELDDTSRSFADNCKGFLLLSDELPRLSNVFCEANGSAPDTRSIGASSAYCSQTHAVRKHAGLAARTCGFRSPSVITVERERVRRVAPCERAAVRAFSCESISLRVHFPLVPLDFRDAARACYVALPTFFFALVARTMLTLF